MIDKEKSLHMNAVKSCVTFKNNCIRSKNLFRDKIIKLKKNGKKICGYAASAKSTTMLNFCIIGNKYIDYIADSTKEKINKFSPGMHIPIVSINFFRKNYPDVAILCSWNHRTEIQKKEKDFTKNKGKWISHVD
jgi:methylation protein EvaC